MKKLLQIQVFLGYCISGTYNAPTTGAGRHEHAYQDLLWAYLYDNKTTIQDVKDIVGDITIKKEDTDATLVAQLEDYIAKIENFDPSVSVQEDTANNRVKVTVSGCSDYDLFYKGIDGTEIEITSKAADNIYYISKNDLLSSAAEVRLVGRQEKVYVKYRLLKRSNSQRILVVTKTGTETLEEEDTASIPFETDVSLQKYIVAVNGDELTATDTDMITRSDKRTYDGDNTSNIKDNISTSNSVKAIDASNYKRNKPVKIEVGDTVTYRIYVYNNSAVEAKNIKIKDRLPYYYTGADTTFDKKGNKGVAVSTASGDIIIKDNDDTTISYTNTTDADNGCKEINWTIEKLAANSSKYYDVTLKFNRYLSGTLTNSVWINGSTPENARNYRLADRDYVEMKKYQVSLNKYVVKVGSTDIAERDSLGKTDKSDAPVEVGLGDTVTYRIKLTNTGDSELNYGAIKNLVVTDTCPTGLTFDSCSSTVTKNSSNNQFTYAGEIAVGASVTFDIKYRVNDTATGTIINTATVSTSLKDKEGTSVGDDDGAGNNSDSDWIKVNQGDISLQKYIIKVNGSNLSSATVELDSDDTTLTDRANRKTRTGEPDSATVLDKIKPGVTASNEYKYDKPVKIEVGDTVTYRIDVYNNSDKRAANVTVKDRLPYYYTGTDTQFNKTDNKGIAVSTNSGDIIIKHGSNATITPTISTNGTNGCKELSWQTGEIAAGATKSYYVTLKFDKYVSGKLTNTAWISSTTPTNETDCRTRDKDFVEMKKYQVSLKKYVVKVGSTTISGRGSLGKTDKSDAPVEVGLGDTVTYRIKLTNTGNTELDYGIIKNLVITDTCPTGLTFDSCSSSVTKNSSNNSFTYTGEIAVDSSVTFDIKYKVEDTATGTIINTATVSTSLKDKEGTTVGDNDGDENNSDSDWIKIKPVNISLQKYIVKVNGDNLTSNDTELTDRANRKTRTGEPDSARVLDKIKTGVTASDEYKYDKQVKIEVGDTVTYRIDVYNNSDKRAANVTVKDRLPYYYTGTDTQFNKTDNKETAVSTNTSNIVIKDNSNTAITPTISTNGTNGCKELSWKTGEIAAGATKSYYVTLKFDKYVSGKLTNTAWISSTTPTNEPDCRTLDKDYVSMKQYKVSLKKYVLKVNDTIIDGRSGHPIYAPNGFSKGNNPVRLEAGDEVTFRILLTNEGKTDVKVAEILDTYDNNSNANIIYQSISGKDHNENSITSKLKVSGQEGNKTITIEEPPTIKPDKFIKIDITFKVEVPYNNTDVEQLLKNTAEIEKIINKHDIEVNNSIEEGHDKDSDWVKTKIYTVRLEKYVSAVNGNSLNTNPSDLEYNCNIKPRSGYATYSSNADKKIAKENDPVLLEVGDTVTYTIELFNNATDTNKYGAIQNLEVEDNIPLGLEYTTSPVNRSDVKRNGNKFTYEPAINVNSSGKFTITYTVTSAAANIEEKIINTATVSIKFENSNGEDVKDSGIIENNTDSDWIRIKKIAISLDKYVSAINGENIANRSGVSEYLTIEGGKYVDKTKDDTRWTRHNTTKFDNPVSVEKGDHVTYTIKVTNDGEARVYIDNITDELTSYGISKYYKGGYSSTPTYTTDLSDRTVYLKRAAAILLKPGESTTVKITVVVCEPNESIRILTNNAKVTGFKNKNNIAVNDTTPYNNEDNDYIQLDFGNPTYTSVSVEKVWENNANKTIPNSIQVQLYRNGQSLGNSYKVTLNKANNWKHLWPKLSKYDSNGNEYQYHAKEVEVPNGFVATYSGTKNRIIITNTSGGGGGDTVSKTVKKEWLYDGEGIDRPTQVTVQLYKNGVSLGNSYKVTLSESNDWTHTWSNLTRYDSNRNEYVYTMQEENIPEHYKVEYKKDGNTYIIKNKYNDNDENPDIIIGGYVWNDKAFDKNANDYNGLMQSEENKLEGIKVHLYRKNVGLTKPVATTTTNSTGYYGFSNSDIDKTVVTQSHKQYIKAEKEEGTQRWSDTYYSYYVVFEYDGITYTSTPDGTSIKEIFTNTDYTVDSNAREDNPNGKQTNIISRDEFNNSIDPNSGIQYYTVNENGKVPQSIHTYTNEMQASTNSIDLGTLFRGKTASDQAELNVIEDKLKHVGLGLRGRDIFDLELTSDVYEVKVTVNNQQAVYEYNNKVTLRQEDLDPNATTTEDMGNVKLENSNIYVDKQEQYIRKTDYNVDTTAYSEDQGVSAIEVTYKITVHNTSNTKGKATKITNYYDSKYTFKKAKDSSGNTLSTSAGTGGTGYKTRIITTPGTMLNQAEQMEIYLVYTLKTPIKDTLSGLTENNPIPTFNMVEITEYYTAIGDGQTKYTTGLIDKDSAPNSAKKEQVRLTTTVGQNTPTTGGNPTTVGYYFGGNDLTKLKYEDDTYAAPTIYFVLVPIPNPPPPGVTPPPGDYSRTIEGYVFEDKTSVDSTTKIKTGNGIKDADEVGVYGATVELIEVDSNGENGVVRYITTTNDNGKFEFKNFLPGYYIIRYRYGDTTNTVLLDTKTTGINGKSYNGEDFQATNNTGKAGEETKSWLNKLNDTANFWYLYNESEGISTATDNTARRNDVCSNVVEFTNPEMEVLNKMRKGDPIDASKVQNVINKTNMYAETPKMLFTLEKSDIVTNASGEQEEVQRKVFSEYKVSNMNFGIAEVPVTTIDFKKRVKEFTITDSTGQNIIARLVRNGDEWDIDGDIYVIGETLDVSIEDQKLQGARLEVTYNVITDIDVEINFDNTSPIVATIGGLADFIDNNLTYNENLGNNATYWEVTTYDAIQEDFQRSGYRGTEIPRGALDPDGNTYNTVIRAKAGNPILDSTTTGTAIATVTLEKVLSSTDSTIEEIITSTIEPFVYNNKVEITRLEYGNTGGSGEDEQRDRIRTPDRFIIIPGVQCDTAESEEIVIHPPTGDSSISTVYYIIAAISLTVLAIGVFGIKKFVVKK